MTESALNFGRGGQLSAIAELRWRMFFNSLRSRRGKLELFSRIIVSCVFAFGALGGAVGMGAGAYFFISEGHAEYLAFFFVAGDDVLAGFSGNGDCVHQ